MVDSVLSDFEKLFFALACTLSAVALGLHLCAHRTNQ